MNLSRGTIPEYASSEMKTACNVCFRQRIIMETKEASFKDIIWEQGRIETLA
jgi:hypothetical protein